MGKIASLTTLNPNYRYLPYCASIKDVGTKQDRRLEVTYLKTYPSFPWLPESGDHREEDPIEFIEACAEAGLVHWEMKEDAERRHAREYAEEQRLKSELEEYGNQ